MEELTRVRILQVFDNLETEAKIVQLTADIAEKLIDDIWWSGGQISDASIKEADSHWRWKRIVERNENDVLSESVAILSQEGYVEGAMTFKFNAISKLEENEGSVYVEWLASAPRNRNWLTTRPKYQGIGTVLLSWAVRQSYLAGLGGRISLQSLPTQNTLKFYITKGLIRTDLTQPSTGLIDFELPTSAAIEWLRKEGDLP